MIQFTYKQYIINIYNELNYNIDSTNNSFQYNLIYSSEEKSLFHPSSKHGIKVYKNDICLASALVYANGGATGIYENSVIINKDLLLVCCGDFIFCITLPELEMLWKTKADDATCFGVYKLNDDYIIHGELCITKLNQNGKIQWSVSGADIFTTPDSDNCFEIKKDYILVKDWNKNEYWIAFDGKIVYDTIRKN